MKRKTTNKKILLIEVKEKSKAFSAKFQYSGFNSWEIIGLLESFKQDVLDEQKEKKQDE